MKTFKSLPTDTGFFNRYAGLLPTLYLSGYLAQLVSLATEIGVVYAIIHRSAADFLPPDQAHRAALLGAVVVSLFLEVALRQFLPFSVRAILYKRFAKLDAVMSVCIIGVAGLLLFASGFLSFEGSRDLVEYAAPPAQELPTTAADSLADSRHRATLATWQADSAAIAAKYAGLIGVQRARLEALRQREAATGQSFATQASRARERIAAIEADRGQALADAWQANRATLASIDQAHQVERDSIRATNAAALATTTAKVDRYGAGLGWFTVICLVVLLVSVVLVEVSNKGAGIEESHQVSPYHFAPAIWSEARAALADRLHQVVRSKITTFADATDAAPLPAAVHQLYDATGLTNAPAVRLELEPLPNGDVIRLAAKRYAPTAQGPGNGHQIDPQQALEYLIAAAQVEATAPTVAQELRLRADDVLTMYLGPAANPATLEELRAACLAYLDGTGANPFAHHHRRPIGYQPGHQATAQGQPGSHHAAQDALTQCVKDASTPTAQDGAQGIKTGNCAHCANVFAKRTTWQKYCSEDCRRDAHAQRHGGKAFDPNYKPWQ